MYVPGIVLGGRYPHFSGIFIEGFTVLCKLNYFTGSNNIIWIITSSSLCSLFMALGIIAASLVIIKWIKGSFLLHDAV